MARIPTDEGREQLTGKGPAVRQTGGLFSTEIIKASREFAKVAGAVAKRFEETQALAEKTKAGTDASRKLRELQLEAGEQRTIEDIAKFEGDYKNRIGKIREEATKAINLPQAKKEFGRSFDNDALLFDFNIKKTLRANQNEALEAILNENLSEQREIFISGSAQMRQASEAKRDLLLTEAVHKGVIKPDSARKVKATTQKEWRLAKIDADIEGDAEFALKQLQLGSKGIYADTAAGDRNIKQATANQKIARDKKIAERRLSLNYDTSENDLAARIFSGEATLREVNEAELNGAIAAEGGVSKEFATVARRALESVKAVGAEDEIRTYSELSRDFFNLNIEKAEDISDAPFEQVAAFRAKVMQKHSDGLITASTANNWIKLVTGSYNAATKDIVRSKFRNGKIINQAIALGSQRLPEEDQLEAFRYMDKKLTERLLSGDIPEAQVDEVALSIFKDFVRKNNPELLGLADVPNSLFDSQKGFDNVSNQPSKAETKWEFREGKMFRVGETKPAAKPEE